MSGKIAIVGAGPSGCFLAQALLKAEPDLEVDVIESLPVPYGLVRYGVAADHQGTKGVARQFARIFERQGAKFLGNIVVGRDVSLDALRQAYDGVILAAGLSKDRRLGIPGDHLHGIYGASALTRALYDHPDAVPLPDIGSRPVIIGNGNVAIDLLRLLVKTPDELAGTDLGESATRWLENNQIEVITIVGRSPAVKAKFDPVMIKELHKLGNVTISAGAATGGESADERKILDALAAIDGMSSGDVRIDFRFGLRPIAVEGEKTASAVRFQGAHGEEVLSCSSILSAIGFEAPGDLPRAELFANAGDPGSGRLADGLYATGWFRRGPRGTIPENRSDAQQLATIILNELTRDSAKPGRRLFDAFDDVVTYEGWQRIDAHEVSTAHPNRCRNKIPSRGEMLQIAAGQEKST